MDKSIFIEIFGYIGTILVIGSMLMSSMVKLRIVSTLGSTVSGIYALINGALPLVLMNGVIVIINIYNLIKLSKTKQENDLVEDNARETLA